MPLNPWLVENMEAFSFYCCPECVFRSKDPSFFQLHALQNHAQSKSFFHGIETNEQLGLESEKVKQELLEVEPDILEMNDEPVLDDPVLDEMPIKNEILDDNEIKKEDPLDDEEYYMNPGLDESSFPVKKRKVFTVLKSDDSDKNGEPQFWKEGVFSTMSENSLNNYKRYWNTFCTLSYIDNQQICPTEEMYVDYFTREKEAGRNEKALWVIYLALKKVTLHLHGQKLQNFTKVKALLSYAEKERRQGKKKDDPGVCPHCGEHFKCLKQHIMYKHETAKPWKCDLCDFSHSLKKGLDGHKRACHTDESNLKVCHICGYKAATNQTMRMHIEAKHEKKRDFACNVCDAKFYRKFKLDLHVRVNHLGEKPHKCPDCGIAFSIMNKLNVHKRLVHEGRKFSCDICGMEYNSQKSVKRHSLKAHGVEQKRKFKYGKPKV